MKMKDKEKRIACLSAVPSADVMIFESIDSTNTEARRRAASGKSAPALIIANSQTAGRGRLGRSFYSPASTGLYMTAVFEASAAFESTVLLTTAAAVSVARAIERLAGITVGIKWVNDLYLNDKKICGILCERSGDNVIIGIGVNVNQTAFPPEISQRATSVRIELGTSYDVVDVRDGVLDRLSECIERWRQNGFAALLPELSTFDCLKGQRVAVRRTDDDGAPADGLCGGIRPDGMLDVAGEAISAGEAHVVA
jgi:BirA family biotin operon repressor/biotin-[acetyl-CoA-carboxylase] ligase